MFLALFGLFFANFAVIKKNFYQKSMRAHHPHTTHHINAKFDVFRPTQSWDIAWRKTGHPPTNPDHQTLSLFRHPWTWVFRWITVTTCFYYVQKCVLVEYNNLSFTNHFIRPWQASWIRTICIHRSNQYQSLKRRVKTARLTADCITCFDLSSQWHIAWSTGGATRIEMFSSWKFRRHYIAILSV